MSELTAIITSHSVNSIRNELSSKINGPYLANGNTVKNFVTDMDHHPYSRWYRGVYYYPDPIIAEREAGWRPIRNSCYNVNFPKTEEEKPINCFEAPCTTTFPCYPKYLTKYADKEALDVMINSACISQYR